MEVESDPEPELDMEPDVESESKLEPEQELVMKPSDAAVYVMPFGKHRGLTLLQIAQQDPTYLDWAADNIRDPVVRDVLITAVEEPTIRRLIERAVYGD